MVSGLRTPSLHHTHFSRAPAMEGLELLSFVGGGFSPKQSKDGPKWSPLNSTIHDSRLSFFSVGESTLHHNTEERICKFWLLSSNWSEKNTKEICINQ